MGHVRALIRTQRPVCRLELNQIEKKIFRSQLACEIILKIFMEGQRIFVVEGWVVQETSRTIDLATVGIRFIHYEY